MDWITEQIATGNYIDAQQISPEIDAVLCLLDFGQNASRYLEGLATQGADKTRTSGKSMAASPVCRPINLGV